MHVQIEAVSVHIPVHPGGYEILVDGIPTVSFRFTGLNLQKRKDDQRHTNLFHTSSIKYFFFMCINQILGSNHTEFANFGWFSTNQGEGLNTHN